MPVTIDKFRVEQKKMCNRTGGRNGVYGCSCCRMTGNLNRFKKESRALAKIRLNQSTRDEINQALMEMPAEKLDLEHVLYGEQYEYNPSDYDSPGDYYPDPFNPMSDLSYDDVYSYDFDEDY